MAIPLNPNHAYCAFLSVGFGLAGLRFWPDGVEFDTGAALESLSFLKSLTADLHPLSRTADPIGISERMTNSDEIFYVPLMFGYSSYSREGFRAKPLQFGNAPRGAGGYRGSVLGGVGIALSARSANREAAADLARQIASPEMQAGLYATSGGQPAHAAAWESPEVNQLARNFFTSVRETMNGAMMRPRVAGHRRFQELAGELIHRFLWTQELTPRECLAQCRQLVTSVLLPGAIGARNAS